MPLKAVVDDKITLIIETTDDEEVVVHVEPPFRRNGTQQLDGYFPRPYRNLTTAKRTVSRLMGQRLTWTEY